MSKVVEAVYDAGKLELRLAEPLEGVADHARVVVMVTPTDESVERPWFALSGSLSREAGESLARAVDELFPPWKQ